MKRKLNADETKLTEKGIKRIAQEIEFLQKNLEYNMDLIKRQNYLRDFDNKWRDYLQNQKDREDKRVLEMVSGEIENKIKSKETMESHINKGVETQTG